jgi:hypothetical protein
LADFSQSKGSGRQFVGSIQPILRLCFAAPGLGMKRRAMCAHVRSRIAVFQFEVPGIVDTFDDAAWKKLKAVWIPAFAGMTKQQLREYNEVIPAKAGIRFF